MSHHRVKTLMLVIAPFMFAACHRTEDLGHVPPDGVGGYGGQAGSQNLGGIGGVAGSVGSTAGSGDNGDAGNGGISEGPIGGSVGPTGGAGGATGVGGAIGNGSAGAGSVCATGNGFLPAVQYATYRGAALVALGDLNGDGKIDLAVANAFDYDSRGGANGTGGYGGTAPESPGSVSVLLHDSDGGFSVPVQYVISTQPAYFSGGYFDFYSLVTGDLNGDGKPDLAVTNGGSLSVAPNSENGTFLVPVSYATGNQPTSVAIGDLNGDGKADLAISNRGLDNNGFTGGDVAVLLNAGGGTFVATNYPAGTSPVSVALGDLNGDGKADLAVASGGGISVLLNSGNGTFAAPVSYASGTNPRSVLIGDLNGDGKPDLAVGNGGVSVALNVGNGTFTAPINYGIANDYLAGLALGDVNGDGKADLVGVSTCGAAVLLNGGNGTFNAPPNYYPVGGTPRSVTIGDVNGDGKLDLVVANSVGVSVLLNASH